ncbi:MAG TPA: hypothetical protein VL991_04010 [Terracidiphilus sp.]|nr:hypothetical protein [Terracidiphilus sp.]
MHRTTVQFDKFLHQGQADPCALVGSCAPILDPVEALEDPRHLI